MCHPIDRQTLIYGTLGSPSTSTVKTLNNKHIRMYLYYSLIVINIGKCTTIHTKMIKKYDYYRSNL